MRRNPGRWSYGDSNPDLLGAIQFLGVVAGGCGTVIWL